MEIKHRDIWAIVERMQADIARELRTMLGEEQYDQRIFDEAERERRIDALIKCALDPSQTPAERHTAWCQMHLDNGWVYGSELKPSEKQHPNLKPWDELPTEVRSKANVFAICARAAADIEALVQSNDAVRELTETAQADGLYR